MIALAVAIGLLVIFLTMYTTVIERTRDIGVLKSLGAIDLYCSRAALLIDRALVRPRNRGRRRIKLPVRAAFLPYSRRFRS